MLLEKLKIHSRIITALYCLLHQAGETFLQRFPNVDTSAFLTGFKSSSELAKLSCCHEW